VLLHTYVEYFNNKSALILPRYRYHSTLEIITNRLSPASRSDAGLRAYCTTLTSYSEYLVPRFLTRMTHDAVSIGPTNIISKIWCSLHTKPNFGSAGSTGSAKLWRYLLTSKYRCYHVTPFFFIVDELTGSTGSASHLVPRHHKSEYPWVKSVQ
jgi:hypothetical protein